jgi:hypothetical protein
MLSMQLICMPPLLVSIAAVVLPKRLDISLFSKLYLSKLKTVVEQVLALLLFVLCLYRCCHCDYCGYCDVVVGANNTQQVQDLEDDARVRQGRPYCSLCTSRHSSGFTAKSLSTVMVAVAASVPDDHGQNQVTHGMLVNFTTFSNAQ